MDNVKPRRVYGFFDSVKRDPFARGPTRQPALHRVHVPEDQRVVGLGVGDGFNGLVACCHSFAAAHDTCMCL